MVGVHGLSSKVIFVVAVKLKQLKLVQRIFWTHASIVVKNQGTILKYACDQAPEGAP
jgi:hypothetical protein